MRKIIEIISGQKIDLLPSGIDLDKHEIVRLWTVYDEERMWTWKKFDTQTGERLERPSSLEEVELKHHEGIFLEDRIHDWNIRQGNLLDYYSRVVGQNEEVKILIEYKEK
ncbi:hypothetical protein CVD28_01225 [Bacillus sp. M6-12]|uniref:hypothetical protein n=1 Tax=Bacillus sp. M6-12 TaxID=2054166 RepID=UPI000C791A3B|nr:hypothetical protein [Bacillus sp. M6-12]PLS19055.1 hypothetical protein CVD28_01225 [Bacillus sp. M6-12]